jgi:hypothetical protein
MTQILSSTAGGLPQTLDIQRVGVWGRRDLYLLGEGISWFHGFGVSRGRRLAKTNHPDRHWETQRQPG